MNNRKITTIAQLDALPQESIVATSSGIQYKRTGEGRWSAPHGENTPSRFLLNADHSRQPLLYLVACESCARPMRPQRESLAAFPGTVKTGTNGECSTCTTRHVLREIELTLCVRCGYPVRTSTLCPDCRDTMTIQEKRRWMA
jgi:hypothetical protein